MKKLKFYFLLLVSFISLQLQAQHKVQGLVLDTTGESLIGISVKIKGTTTGTVTNEDGRFSMEFSDSSIVLIFSYPGFKTQEKVINGKSDKLVIVMQPNEKMMSEVVVTALGINRQQQSLGYHISTVTGDGSTQNFASALYGMNAGIKISKVYGVENEEDYKGVIENDFHEVKDQPLNTFSIDVDRASYSNIRRFLNSGNLPPTDAVRIEEMINYFDYNYKNPTGKDPVAVYTDMANCPWNRTHQLVRVALKAKEVPLDNLPAANIVFLLDVSGSMRVDNKLPLVKQALKALVQQLRPSDKVAIVVYAGAAGVVLPSTPGSEKGKILDALEQLEAGGSTAGGEGIQLAYKTAMESFIKEGNNRVILATDGDFNVGESGEEELEKLIESERSSGISLSVLGFGMGNYKDSKLELLADKGNGNYAYIDNFEEARRTFVTEFGGTLFTIAKDVKLQLEFNPQYVQSYRLIGYENRMLQDKDFNDDKKDAGDMGVGHTVTALYEIVPAGSRTKGKRPTVDSLKYQHNVPSSNYSGEALTVKLRYKQPQADSSQLLTHVMPWKTKDIQQAPEDFRMAAAVATFGLLLKNSAYKSQATYKDALSLAEKAKGEDKEGYRAEFIQMIKKAMVLSNAVK